jgi:hypothetical protein
MALDVHATWEVHAMDTDRFDGLTRTLATTGSRRWILATLAGGLFTAWGGRRVGASNDKVSICHRTSSRTNSMVVIEVSVDAVADHLAHGDFYYDQCCLDGDCGGSQRCVDGSCQEICVRAAEVCTTNNDCCAPLCCDINHVCDNDCGFD